MNYRQLKEGEKLIVGDEVLHETCFNQKIFKVYRTTKTLAVVRYNDVADGKFPIVYNRFFGPIPRHPYSTSTYKVFRPVINDALEERRALEVMDAQGQMQEMRKDSKEVQ